MNEKAKPLLEKVLYSEYQLRIIVVVTHFISHIHEISLLEPSEYLLLPSQTETEPLSFEK